MASQLEVLYNRRDVVRRRHLVREAVAVQPGEHVLDVGCGPGFYVKELLDQVGVGGSVTGVDVSRAMLAVAAKRVDGHDNVAFYEAEATKLPVPDHAFDAAVSVQVLEYVPDVAAALDGTFTLSSEPGDGTHIRAEIPLSTAPPTTVATIRIYQLVNDLNWGGATAFTVADIAMAIIALSIFAALARGRLALGRRAGGAARRGPAGADRAARQG